MPEPISTALSLCIGFATLNGYRRNDSAISPEAKYAVTTASAVMRSAENSQALFGAKAVSISSLQSMADECVGDDWDGNGALGIDPLAVWNAQDFIRALPAGFPLPEFAPEPDGSISLDWICSRHRLFSLTVGAGNRLAYAWLDGTDKGHGVAQFDGVTVPSRILSEIRPIVNYGIPSLRAA